MTAAIAISSAVLGATLAYIYASHKDYIQTIRVKLEDVYVSFDEFDRSLAPHILSHMNLARDDFDYAQFIEFTSNKENMPGAASHLNKIVVISSMYFPSFVSKIEDYKNEINVINGLCSQIRRAAKHDMERPAQSAERLRGLSQRLTMSADELRTLILQEARRIGSQEMLIPNLKDKYRRFFKSVKAVVKGNRSINPDG